MENTTTGKIKAADLLRTLTPDVLPGTPETRGIINGHDVARVAKAHGLPPVYVDYTAGESGRAWRPARWSVTHLDHQTDPDAHWMHHGTKVFLTLHHPGSTREAKEAARQAALAWAGERYGVTEWATIPGVFGGKALFPKPVADLVNAAVKQARKAAR